MQPALPTPVLELAERYSDARLAGGGAFGAAALGLLTIWATGALDLVLIVAAIGSVTGGLGLVWTRRKLATLPLELAPLAMTSHRHDTQIYQFRVWLGRGRAMRSARAEVVFDGEGGRRTLFELPAPVDVMVGPWTIQVEDRDQACSGPGTFTVKVTVQDKGVQRSIESRYPESTEGVFALGFERRPRFRWIQANWGRPA